MTIEAFVYCWTDKTTNMLYVGSHKGSTTDGYICSSKYMLKEYRKRPQDFSRQVIAEGNLDDVRKLEAAKLKNNPLYKKEHSERMKLWWAQRKIKLSEMGG